MSYHVPFHMRNQNTGEKPPVYIGFEAPRRPLRRFSFMGFFGFLLCVFTCGALAPFSLIMSLIGLRKGPNFFSVAGTVLSSLALAGMTMGLVGNSIDEHHRMAERRARIQHQKVHKMNEETRSTMVKAEKEFRAYKSENENKLPSPMTGSMMAVHFRDAWDQELRYEVEPEFCILRSAGADMEYETGDDLIRKIAGQPIMEFDISMDSDLSQK